MSEEARTRYIDEFLGLHGWQDALRDAIPGDASFRRYERVSDGARSAILMDAPPDAEDTRPFLQVARHLAALGYSAPAILAENSAQGFLLLEDLGDDSFSRVLKTQPEKEAELYDAATAWLADLHAHPQNANPALPPYDEALYLREASLFSDSFLPAALGQEKAADLREGYLSLWRDMLAKLPPQAPVFVHRDYHADNLLWLPARGGMKKIGLLDFQDAVLGHPAYDLVSILEDARRDVPTETVAACMDCYLKQSGAGEKDFRLSYALLGAQRNSKIIGIFTRLNMRDGKPQYLKLLPRVWAHLERDLAHPALQSLKMWLDRHVPPETRLIGPA